MLYNIYDYGLVDGLRGTCDSKCDKCKYGYKLSGEPTSDDEYMYTCDTMHIQADAANTIERLACELQKANYRLFIYETLSSDNNEEDE